MVKKILLGFVALRSALLRLAYLSSA